MARVSVLRPLMTVAVVMSVLVGMPAHTVGTNPASGAAAMQSPPSSFSAADAFHWLDPIAPSSGDTARLDAALLNYLTVEVCEVTNAGGPTVRTFTSEGPQLRAASHREDRQRRWVLHRQLGHPEGEDIADDELPDHRQHARRLPLVEN